MDKKVLLICIDGMRYDYLNHSDIKIPNIRSLLREGSSVGRLESIWPSVTWAAHTSVVTGCYPLKHKVLANRVLDLEYQYGRDYFEVGTGLKDDVIMAPTIYDALYQNGGKTAAICWPLSQGASTIDYNIPEFYLQEYFDHYTSASFWKELEQKGLPVHRYGEWSTLHAFNPMQDWLTKEIINYVIDNKITDFIMGHYLLMDSFLHDYGNHKPEIYWALEYLDSLIGETLSLLDRRNELDKTDVIVFSDHGHSDYTNFFYPNKVLFEAGLHVKNGGGEGKCVAIVNGGSFFVYGLSKNEKLIPIVTEIFKSLPYVKKIFVKEDFYQINFPVKTGGKKEYSPDMIVEVTPGYNAKEELDVSNVIIPTPVRSQHGYGSDFEKMDAFLVAKGPSFKKGSHLERAGLIDIAPTLAAMFGIKFDSVDGSPLLSILNEGVTNCFISSTHI